MFSNYFRLVKIQNYLGIFGDINAFNFTRFFFKHVTRARRRTSPIKEKKFASCTYTYDRI